MAGRQPAVLWSPVILAIGLVLVLGCMDKAVTVGAVLPLTGDTASYGKAAQRGVDLAVSEINESGGIGGSALKVIYEDDQGVAARAVSAMEKLTSVNRVPAIVGSAGSSVTLAMCSMATRSEVALLTPISSSKDLSTCSPFFFRVCPSDVVQARLMADWLLEDGRKRVGVVYVNNSWGQGLREEFEASFKAKGGEIVGIEACNEGDRDLRSQLTKLKAAAPDAIYGITYGREGGALLQQAKELGLAVPFYGADVWSSPELTETGGDAAHSAKIIAPSKLQSSTYSTFATKFRNRYVDDPDVYAAYSYDLLHILALALKEGGRGEELRLRLAGTRYQGVTGLTVFDKHGDVVGKGFERRVLE